MAASDCACTWVCVSVQVRRFRVGVFVSQLFGFVVGAFGHRYAGEKASERVGTRTFSMPAKYLAIAHMHTISASEAARMIRNVYLLLPGGSIGIIGWSSFIDDRAVGHDPLAAAQKAAHGINETAAPSIIHLCHRNIAMATAFYRHNRRHSMRNGVNHNNGTVPQHHSQIWPQSKGICYTLHFDLYQLLRVYKYP